jgi:prophage regulatory protein
MPNTPESLLRLEAVKARTGLGRSMLYAMIADGRFPGPIHITGTRISAWPSSAVDRWIAAQIGEAA